jgi:hypothetical protein
MGLLEGLLLEWLTLKSNCGLYHGNNSSRKAKQQYHKEIAEMLNAKGVLNLKLQALAGTIPKSA